MSDRKEAYRAVLERFNIDPEDDSYSGGEDAAEWLSGEREICRYCVVTSGGEFTYAYAYDDTMETATERAFMNIYDDIFPESPIVIINLDTGEEWEPDFSAIRWRTVVKN